MTTYYLIPVKWEPSGETNRFEVYESGEGIRTFDGSQKKAQAAGEAWEREMNGGELFSPERLTREKTSLINVEVSPYHQARDYRRFSDWPCNQDDPEQAAKEARIRAAAPLLYDACKDTNKMLLLLLGTDWLRTDAAESIRTQIEANKTAIATAEKGD